MFSKNKQKALGNKENRGVKNRVFNKEFMLKLEDF